MEQMEQAEKKRKGRPRKKTQEQENSIEAAMAEPVVSEPENAAEEMPGGEKNKSSGKSGRTKKAVSTKPVKTAKSAKSGAKKQTEKKAEISTESLAAAEQAEQAVTAEQGEQTEQAEEKVSPKGKSAAAQKRQKKTASKEPAKRGRRKKEETENNIQPEAKEPSETKGDQGLNSETEAKTVLLAISAEERPALGASELKELPHWEHSQSVPAELSKSELAVYEQGQLAAAAEKTAEKPEEHFGNKVKKTAGAKAETAKTPKNGGRKKKAKTSIDFVAGVNGVAEYNGEESLSAFGEQAGLGVLGVIEEAPVADAVLPLVNDGEKTVKKSRKRGRKKKVQKPAESVALPEYDNSPIVEGGEIARIEAEESLRNAKKSKKESKAEKKENVRRVLYVSTVPDEQAEVVITENGVVSEYFVEMAHQSKIRGNIYKGVINNVDTNLQAAFVNFGCGKNGFLQIDEVHPEYYLAPHDDERSKYPPIQKVLKVGQEVLVQVVKEPNGSKGAFLTTWLSLAGRFLVLTPGQEQIGVSRKVEDNEERQRLRALLNGIKPGENMGVIIRTASEGASKASIQKDLQLLKRTWKNIQKQVVKSPAPSLVYQEADLAGRAVRDYLNDDIDEVWVDSKEVQKSVAELVKVLFPKNKDMLHLHDDMRQTLWERFNIARQLEEVTKREVNLPSGGRLVFDQTEALMAIDINSGKSQGKNNFEAMVYRTNMEAVEAIARHLRLRDIGGQVVIDFIEMRDKSHCRDVEKALHAAMKRDRARHDIGKLSSFGLLELVRQRTGSSVISITSEPCPHCRGTGFRRNLEWQAQGVLRDIRSKLAGKNVPSTYVHHVDQEIAFYLLNKKRDRLSDLEQEFGVRIEIHLK